MWSRNKESSIAALCIFLVITLSLSPIEVSAPVVSDGLKDGPFLDKIVYNVIGGDDQQVLALQNNEIDLIGDFVDPTFVSSLESASNIEMKTTLRNGYGLLVINTAKNPFNYTAFRRACAFAMSKYNVCDLYFDGLAVPQDSLIPQINPFSVEGQLPYSYYESDFNTANQLLDDAGFAIDPVTGYRLDPHGNPFSVTLETASCPCITIEGTGIIADALQKVHIDAVSTPTDFYDYINRLYTHGDYDMVYIGQSFLNYSIDWMAHDYWSGNADEPYYNFPNWQNSSFDMWRDQLLHATDYDDVYEAAIEMQKVWTYECPCIIIYENQYFTAHRTDTFEVFASDISKGACSWWTNFKSHLIDGPLGGTLRWSTPLYTDSFNIMLSSSAYTMDVLQMLYDSLFKLGPENNPIPWLVESYTIKTHVDDPIVLEDHTRFTFDIIRNATWSDGNPLTAEDIAFSLNYYRINSSHPFSNDLSDMTAVYAPTKTQLIVEFETESYWHINKFAFKPVIPMHKFVNRTWNEWDPVPPYDEMVTSGPFNVTAYTAGEFVELSRNPNYHYQPSYYTTTTTSCRINRRYFSLSFYFIL